MNSRFSILAAVRNGYLFVAKERSYLARLAVLPLGVVLITNFMAHYSDLAITQFGEFLISLPARILFGWFMFMEVRLLLLGERAPLPQQDNALLFERHRCLKLCILIWLLYNAWWTVFIGYTQWLYVQQLAGQQNGALMLLFLFLLGASIWAIRFSVAHILAAVGYPIRKYVFRVNGIAISLRLTGMAIVCLAPVWFLVAGMDALLTPAKDRPSAEAAAIMIVFLCVAWTAVVALLTASASYALKEILGGVEREKVA